MVGGVCINTGTIPSKTLRESVLYVTGLSQREFYGQSYRLKDEISVADLTARTQHVIGREIDVIRSQLARNHVRMLVGTARFSGPNSIVVLADDGNEREYSAEKFIVAVGTKPARPSTVDFDGRTVVDSDQILDMDHVPPSMVVVGAGVIGIEYASMFAALGVQVTVIDQRPRPLEFLDHELVDELIHQMRKSDVVFRCGDAVEQIEVRGGDSGRQGLLRLASGKHLVADVVLFSAGRIGSTASLNLEAAGLSADERGRLTVDDHYRTAVDHIWAAGDVIGFPALAATSSEQGRLAACWMFGVDAKPMGDHFPVGIYSIPEVSMVGATEEDLTKRRIPYETGIARYKEISRGSIRGDDSGMFKMLFHREDGRLLGCHCIGSGATELIHVGQAVLALGGGLDYFLTTVFNYPTLAECYKVAAHNAANKLALVKRISSLSIADVTH
jgi:NAD(P) transhydrogenase